MNSESILKGRIAEDIVELLLEQSGYRVKRIAEGGLLNGFDREESKKFNQSNAAGRVVTAPSFVVTRDNQVTLVKVKFWGAKKSGGNIMHGIKQVLSYWPEAELLIVTTEDPHFVYVSGDSPVPLEKLFPKIKEAVHLEATALVEKFLK